RRSRPPRVRTKIRTNPIRADMRACALVSGHRSEVRAHGSHGPASHLFDDRGQETDESAKPEAERMVSNGRLDVSSERILPTPTATGASPGWLTSCPLESCPDHPHSHLAASWCLDRYRNRNIQLFRFIRVVDPSRRSIERQSELDGSCRP